MDTTSSAHPTAPVRPALVTDDADLLDDLLRVCAAANVTPDVVVGASQVRQCWSRSATVIVGEDRAESIARLGLTRREHVLLVSHRADAGPLWPLAVRVRADGILLMPGDQDRLVTHLVDLADGNRRGTTIGVIGGCGGVGATVTAAALALTAARTGRSTLLVDADPHGGGIDLVLGCEDSVGVRWPEVAATNGRVSAAAFRAALPATGSLRVLSWDRTAPRQPSPDVMRTMLEAAQRGSELVLVDLPRAWDEAAVQALLLTDTVLLVTCPDVRGVAAAGCLLTGLRDVCSDVRLLVRGARGADLDSHEVADSLGIPLAGRVPTQRGLPRALDEGLGPLARGSLERTCRRLLDHVLEPGEAVP